MSFSHASHRLDLRGQQLQTAEPSYPVIAERIGRSFGRIRARASILARAVPVMRTRELVFNQDEAFMALRTFAIEVRAYHFDIALHSIKVHQLMTNIIGAYSHKNLVVDLTNFELLDLHIR